MPILTRTTHYASRTNIATVLGTSASAMALLAGETEGFAIDATTSGGSLAIIDTGTPANNKNDVALSAGNLTNAGTSAKIVRWNDGTLHTFTAGQIAQEFDGTRFGILIEQAATNLCIRSQELDHAAWTQTRLTVSANATTAPDDTLTADKLVESVDNNTHELTSTSCTISSGATYTASMFFKAAERTAVALVWTGASGGIYARANLATGVLNSGVGVTGTHTKLDETITNIGNGWYRVSMTGIAAADTSVTLTVIPQNPVGTDSYAGDGTSGLYAWGADLELGDVASSYNPTTTASAVRDADEIGCATSTYPHDDAAGTFIAWFKRREIDGATNDRILQISNSTDQERVVFRTSTTASPDNPVACDVVDGGVVQVLNALSGGAVNLSGNKGAVAYALNNVGLLADGGAETTDTSATMPTCTVFQLGHAVPEIANRELNGYIYQMTYVPRRMTTVEMQTRTV